MPDEQHIPIIREEDIVLARQEGRALAKALGFGLVDQSRIATAISELARNVIRYAVRGEVILRSLIATDGSGRRGLEVEVADSGPGIVDTEAAMRDGYTTGGGLGMGLPGTKRLMDEFSLITAPGQGTIVTVRKWQR
jgi:serine/threonine-protein kinase RsbT